MLKKQFSKNDNKDNSGLYNDEETKMRKIGNFTKNAVEEFERNISQEKSH